MSDPASAFRFNPQGTPVPPAESPARFVVAVGSGKGGVGKSTVAINLALALASQGSSVGVLDADVYGPDIPLMVNLTRKEWGKSWTLWRNPKFDAPKIEPVERYGVKVMSAGFILGENQPLTWTSDLVKVMLRQFLTEVEWDSPDYLIVDLPPGTADLQQGLVQVIPLSGTVICVTPQDVAHLDAKKVVEMFRSAGVRILGGVENMAGLVCPHCGEVVEVLPTVRDDRSIWSMGVRRLGAVPMDPSVSRSTDAGRPVVVSYPDSESALAFKRIAWTISESLESGR